VSLIAAWNSSWVMGVERACSIRLRTAPSASWTLSGSTAKVSAIVPPSVSY